MTRWRAFLILLVLCAALFLPALGAIELKGGEEGRRILPAITMIETGNWIVPYVCGEPYLRKPPLLNWIIAGSFEITGQRTEWTARIPSPLLVLALVGVVVGLGSRWLTPAGALVAGIFVMTNSGMLEKGRLAEIEALYTALTGIAIVCWITWWRETRSPWLVWIVPFVFLGLGLLAKGPLNLLFFYAVVACVLWQVRGLRELARTPHFVGIVLMVAIFCAWALPYFSMLKSLNAGEVWEKEFAGRVGRGNTFGFWFEEVWNHFENYLPWLLFAPLWWSRRCLDSLSEQDAALARGLRNAIVFCAACLFFTPGVAARYSLPLIVPASLLNALVLQSPEVVRRALTFWRWALLVLLPLAACALLVLVLRGALRFETAALATALAAFAAGVWWLRKSLATAPSLAVASGIATAFSVMAFAILRIPQITVRESSRPMGRQINEAMKDAPELWVVNPNYQPGLFYVKPRCVYFRHASELPARPGFALLHAPAAAEQLPTAPVLARVKDRGGKDMLLVAVGGNAGATPR